MKTSRELQWILAFLKAATGIAAAEPPALREEDWKRWLGLVDENHLGSFLGCHYRRLPAFHLPQDMQMELDMRYLRNGHAAVLRYAELVRILGLLTREADVVLLKGCALYPSFYTEAAERMMWDFDLLLHTDRDVTALEAILQREGYGARKTLTGHHHAPPLINPVNDTIFELHTNLHTPLLSRSAMEDIWQRKQPCALPGAERCFVLDPVSQLLHLSLHALGDPVTAPLVRNLFEIVWMIHRMNYAQRAEVPVLAARWNITTPVARALGLASDLFDAPMLLPRPLRGAYDYWCESRLEWTNRDRWWERFRRHLGQLHIDRLLAGDGERNLWTLVRILNKGIGEAFVARVPGASLLRNKPLLRRTLPHIAIGDTFLVYDHDTGHVHLLNSETAAIWQAAHNRRPRELVKEFSHHGMTPTTIEATIKSLLRQDLLVTPDPNQES